MENKLQKIKKRIIYTAILLVVVLTVVTGCAMPSNVNSNADDSNLSDSTIDSQTQMQEVNEAKVDSTDLYLILEFDEEDWLHLYRYRTGKIYGFSYSPATMLRDKYGNRAMKSDFYAGRAIYIGGIGEDGSLSAMQIADEVWEYDNVSKFSIQQEQGIFVIADTKYRILDNTYVFSNGTQKELSDISENDTLLVIGKEKDILSVVVTKGYGTLQLKNTSLFEGSYLQLNKNIFQMITENMSVEVEEGDYTLSVANNGWGGSCEISIIRDQVTEVDLDAIKGEGPKYGKVKFVVDVEGAVISIDGKEIDYSEPIELTYGEHEVIVRADGYDTEKSKVSVNTEEATLEISLQSTKNDSTTETQKDTEEDSESTTEKQKETSTEQNTETGSTEKQTKKEDAILSDYVDTITNMLDSF